MISLHPMQTEEYSRFEESAIKLYADESARAGRVSREKSLKWAEDETRRILPRGIRTPNHLFYVVGEEEEGEVGYIWCGQDPDEESRVFLFTILIFEQYRNRGIGFQAMKLLESELKTRGYKSIGLHVYSFNKPAVHLYSKLGYLVTDLVMSKQI